MRRLEFLGDTYARLKEFPRDARRDAGYQLDLVEQGLDPQDWKSMPSIGVGVREIRIRVMSGAFRVIYLANLGDVVLVLHMFQKKTQSTAKRDIDLAKTRLKEWRR